jgi:dihydroxyacid dehydratase/phosphogluconate dehydratase
LPESFVGGPLALLRRGDEVRIDVAARSIDMLVAPEALARRRAGFVPPPPRFERGYGWMVSRHIGQAHVGCDFDFLETSFDSPAGEPDIF